MAKTTKFEIYTDAKGHFRWRLIGKNGESVASGEGYTEKRGAMTAAKKLREWAATDVIEEVVKSAKSKTAKK